MVTRRRLAALAASVLAACPGPRFARAAAPGTERLIWAVNQAGEEVVVAYRAGETYNQTALARLQVLFRDLHQNAPGPLPPLLVDMLSLLQERWSYERPLVIASGYRTLPTNAALEGAAPASLHLRGLAADISLRGIPPADLAEAALWLSRRLGFMGLGLYPRFLHLDICSVMFVILRCKNYTDITADDLGFGKS